MEYIEYFNLLNSGYKSISFALSGLPFLLIGIVGLFLIIKFRRSNFVIRRHPRVLLISISFWTAFATFWTSMAFYTTYNEYRTLRNALITDEYKVVEGVVSDFDPMPYTGHKFETFTVNGVKFEYSDYHITNAFNNTKSHGGPIDSEKYVKIYYFDDKDIAIYDFERKILRLWVRE